MKQFILKDSQGGTQLVLKQSHFSKNELTDNDVSFIAKKLESSRNGGIRAERTFTLATEKAYVPSQDHIAMLATVLEKTEAEITDKYMLLKMIASDTTIDRSRDKFTKFVLDELGADYSEGWANGVSGGRSLCIMHNRNKIVGQTYAYEIRDKKDAMGAVVKDENNVVVSELIVYAYLRKSAMWEGEPVIDYIESGSLVKVSIAAWIGGYTYVSESESNYKVNGMPMSYFVFGENSTVEAIELSLVDMGANANATLTKSYNVEITINVGCEEEEYEGGDEGCEMENGCGTGGKKPMRKEVTENAIEKAVELEVETEKAVKTDNEIDVEKAVEKSAELIEAEKALTFWNGLPNFVKSLAPSSWKTYKPKNFNGGEEITAPDYCITLFISNDRTIAKLKSQLSELEGKEKAANVNANALTEKQNMLNEEISNLQKSELELSEKLAQANAILEKEKAYYVESYVALKTKVHKAFTSENRNAFAAECEGLSFESLREKIANMKKVEEMNYAELINSTTTKKEVTNNSDKWA